MLSLEQLSQPPWWLRGGHTQTIWPSLSGRYLLSSPHWQRERWITPDGDFIDADWQRSERIDAPTLVLFHGLEGSSGSHYAWAFAHAAQQNGWTIVVPHFRGCSGELNRAPRAYHSGDYAEIDWMLAQVSKQVVGPVVAVGVSLGGNALLRWGQEHSSCKAVQALVALCAPLDLTAASAQLARGVNRLIYSRHFLRSMVPKGLAKAKQYPGLLDVGRLRAAKDLRDFDEAFTAPLHGFGTAQEYWARCSAGPHMRQLQIPTLVVNPINDPLVPVDSLPHQTGLPSHVQLVRPLRGGHVGFADKQWPGQMQGYALDIIDWLKQQLQRSNG